MRFVRDIARFWYDFLVGDDWRIAAGVVAVLAAGAMLVAADALPHDALAPLTAAGIIAVVTASLLAGSRSR